MDNSDILLIHKAEAFATGAHQAIGHKRKYTGEPYIVHPREVVSLVATVPHTPAMLAAAWLHDVMEDTLVDYGVIERFFGVEVATLVLAVTNVGKPADGSRQARKHLDRVHLSKAPPAAKTIKLADTISNLKDVVEKDPEFAKIYIAEKESLLDVLSEGDAHLWRQAKDLIRALQEKLTVPA